MSKIFIKYIYLITVRWFMSLKIFIHFRIISYFIILYFLLHLFRIHLFLKLGNFIFSKYPNNQFILIHRSFKNIFRRDVFFSSRFVENETIYSVNLLIDKFAFYRRWVVYIKGFSVRFPHVCQFITLSWSFDAETQ